MTTLGDLAQRLYDKFAATQELLEPKAVRFQPTRWDELPEWRQEVWVTVAAEAVKVGVEIQQEIERQDDERLVNHPDLQTSLGQMQRGEGREIDPVLEDMWENVLVDMSDESELAVQPWRCRRDCE